MSEDSAGGCYGMFNQEAGKGEPALGGNFPPNDAAFFLGMSQLESEGGWREGVTIEERTGPMT